MTTTTDPAEEPEHVQEYRRAARKLNGTPEPRPAPRHEPSRLPFGADVDDAPTIRLDQLVEQLAAMVHDADERARQAQETAAEAAARPSRRPLAWSAALVLVVLAVCGLLAWVATLYFHFGAP